jgi:hypothetical protein
LTFVVFDDVFVDEDETRRTERRFNLLFDSTLWLVDDKERFDSLDDRGDDAEAEEVEEAEDDDEDDDDDDDDSSTTIELKKSNENPF